MATRFYDQAAAQLNPVYQQSEQAIQGQLPAIQNLYSTLMQGLQGQFDTSLQSGTKSIVEDASARGVLRSTLPVDARQALTTQLSQALLQGRGELAAKQAGEEAGVRERLGSLQVQKAGGIADLARALETQDLERQKFEHQKAIDNQQLAIARAQASAKSSKSPTAAQNTQAGVSALARELAGMAGRDGYVSPQTYAEGRREWVSAGFSSKSYDDYFSGFKNPKNQNYQYF